MDDRSGAHLYESVAQDISSMISAGTLVAGERVPSVRRLSRQRRVSISTVLEAYRRLEERGLIEARPQSGYYVRATASLPEPGFTRPPRTPQKVGVHALVTRVIHSRDLADVAQFGAAVPHASLLPVRRLQRIVASLARKKLSWVSKYSFPPGEEELRRQISLYMREWGVSVAPDEIVITTGCMEALNLCLRAVAGPGDVIALESPTYFGLLQIIESLGMKALEIPCHPREGVSLPALELALDRAPVKACVLMPTVSNPLGGTMSDAAKKRLVRLLAERDIPLIEDAVYGALHFGDVQPRAAKAYDRRGLVMLCSSFSKTFSPGFRIGWAAPGRYYERVHTLKLVNTLAVPELLQEASAEFLAGGGYHRLLRQIRRRYAEQLERFANAVTRHFPPRTRMSRPTGGFVLWIEMPASVDCMAVYREALKQGIGIAPGSMFSASGRYRNCIRLNCGMPWSEETEQGLRRLGEIVSKLAR